MIDPAEILVKLSPQAKAELIVFAQGRSEIINPLIDEELEDEQTELDVLYELGFLDLDSDEDDEEYARAEFSSDVRQYLSEEIGNTRQIDLLKAVLLHKSDFLEEFARLAPVANSEINNISILSISPSPDVPEP